MMYPLTITALIKETPDTVSIGFDIPDELKKEYAFIPGQYVFVHKEIEGKEYKRAYSITASPFSESLQITVKETPNGDFSTFANTQLQVGDTLEVSTPKGNFILPVEESHANNYLAFASGSGIAPIYPMILAVLENEPKSKFGLFYGNSTEQHTIFKDTLVALQEKYPSRFFLQFVFSKEAIPGALTGRITKRLVDFALKDSFGDTPWNRFFICGQEGMKEEISSSLLANGISEEAIFYELFTKPKKSKNVTMTLVLDGEQKEITVAKDVTVLDAAIQAGLDPSYSCQGGFCTSCMAKIVEGQANMEENTTLNEDEIAEGKVLTCVARATTDKLHVNFDI